MIKLVFLSDTHNRHEQIKMFKDVNDLGEEQVPKGGDVIIHSGDATLGGSIIEINRFLKWYGELSFTHKIFIAGNHDRLFEEQPGMAEQMCKDNGIVYLNDSEVTLTFDSWPQNDDESVKSEEERKLSKDVRTLRIWGSPVQPEFMNFAFNRARTVEDSKRMQMKFIGDHWDLIPTGIDVLVTHGPPHCILDVNTRGERVGCKLLLDKVLNIKPKIHSFGHIHGQYGEQTFHDIKFINASTCDEQYIPSNLPVEIEI